MFVVVIFESYGRNYGRKVSILIRSWSVNGVIMLLSPSMVKVPVDRDGIKVFRIGIGVVKVGVCNWILTQGRDNKR